MAAAARPSRPSRPLAAALLLLGGVLLLGDLAPAFAPASPIAAAVRAALAPTCHQNPARSFSIDGQPLGACARCVGLHAAPLVGGLLLLLLPVAVSLGRGFVLVLAAGGVSLLAAEAALGIAFRQWDHPLLRLATGALAGAGLLAGFLTARSSAPAREIGILRPAVLGGLLAGIASAIPGLNIANCCCCGLVALGGAFAAWVLAQEGGRDQPHSRFAAAGWWAGVLAAFIQMPLGAWLTRLLQGEEGIEKAIAVARAGFEGASAEALPGVGDLVEGAMRGGLLLEINGWTLVQLVFSAVLFGTFGLLGALGVRALLGRGSTPPPRAPEVVGAGRPPGIDKGQPGAAAADGPDSGADRHAEFAFDELPSLSSTGEGELDPPDADGDANPPAGGEPAPPRT